ncbi:MAG: hypothetical protein WAX69_13665 [Victivallales bacterium]
MPVLSELLFLVDKITWHKPANQYKMIAVFTKFAPYFKKAHLGKFCRLVIVS